MRERLVRIQEQLRRVRANERVLLEQVTYLNDVAGDAETRKLVARRRSRTVSGGKHVRIWIDTPRCSTKLVGR